MLSGPRPRLGNALVSLFGQRSNKHSQHKHTHKQTNSNRTFEHEPLDDKVARLRVSLTQVVTCADSAVVGHADVAAEEERHPTRKVKH